MHRPVRSALCLLAILLLVPATVSAKKRKKKAPAPDASAILDSITRPSNGAFARVTSSDLKNAPVLDGGDSMVLGELVGPGVIDRIWLIVDGSKTAQRDIVLRITWDGGSAPSVEAPLGDFFSTGPGGADQSLKSIPMSVSSSGRAMTSYWKMPFAKSARITLTNDGSSETRHLAWEIDYRRVEALPENTSYFHAQYVQADPPEAGIPMEALRATGPGRLVGLSIAVQNVEDGPWGDGRVLMDVDGDPKSSPGTPTLFEYFGGVFGVAAVQGPYQGCTLDEGNRRKARSSAYHFHLNDPVQFETSISVSLEHGVDNERKDRFATVAYWYQETPAVPFTKLAQARKRRWDPPSDEELAAWKKADALNKEILTAYRGGDLATAMTGLEELLQLEPNDPTASYNLACLYALHGKTDQSLHLLENAIQLGFTSLTFAKHDSDLDSLHEHERFWKLVGGKPEPAK
jgi:hypothetical protein